MSRTLAEGLFIAAALAILIAQLFILRSTRRGMAVGPRRARPALEWFYAVLPALALIAVLAWTWRTMHTVAVRADRERRTPGTLS